MSEDQILSASKQTQFHSDTTRGNCFAACLAALTGESLENVPDFYQSADWTVELMKWLYSIGFEYFGSERFPDLIEQDWEIFPFMIVSGKSSRGVNHAVIYHRGAPFWDPHPDNSFITSPKEVYLIKKQ